MEANKRVLHFMADTVECGFDDDKKEFTISGEAIHAITTRNGHTFTVQELQSSARTLQNKPLLKDHINSVDHIVGRVKKASWNAAKRSIDFVARVTDKNMQEKIASGDVVNVSVGAMVDDVEEVEGKDGSYTYTLKGVTFLELSLVAVPADPTAGFSLATAVLSSLKAAPAKTYTITGTPEHNSVPSLSNAVESVVPAPQATLEETTAQDEQATETVAEENEVSTMENDKNQEVILSAISKLTDAVTAINDKVAALETKKSEVVAAVVPAQAAAPESKGVVGQSAEYNKVTSGISLVKTESSIGLVYESYDKAAFKNLGRSGQFQRVE